MTILIALLAIVIAALLIKKIVTCLGRVIVITVLMALLSYLYFFYLA